MGTRAMIGHKKPNDTNVVRGTYIHYNGYPDHTLVQFIEIIKRDGLKNAVGIIVDGVQGWVNIDAFSEYAIPGYGLPDDDMNYPYEGGMVNDDGFVPALFNHGDFDWAYVVDMEENTISAWHRNWGKWFHEFNVDINDVMHIDSDDLRNLMLQYV